jgi:hypothetical protein
MKITFSGIIDSPLVGEPQACYIVESEINNNGVYSSSETFRVSLPLMGINDERRVLALYEIEAGKEMIINELKTLWKKNL